MDSEPVEVSEVNEWDELIDQTLEEIAMIPTSLLNQAVGEDKETVRQSLHFAASLAPAVLNGDEQAKEDLAHVEATLKDIALKYGLRSRAALQETITRFLFRATNVLLDAVIPG